MGGRVCAVFARARCGKTACRRAGRCPCARARARARARAALDGLAAVLVHLVEEALVPLPRPVLLPQMLRQICGAGRARSVRAGPGHIGAVKGRPGRCTRRGSTARAEAGGRGGRRVQVQRPSRSPVRLPRLSESRGSVSGGRDRAARRSRRPPPPVQVARLSESRVWSGVGDVTEQLGDPGVFAEALDELGVRDAAVAVLVLRGHQTSERAHANARAHTHR